MKRALVVYSTRKGATERIAGCIAQGLEGAGIEVRLQGAAEIRREADLEGFDAYIFGSATYHGEMMQHAKQLLFLADKVNLKGKVGGAFGAFGWSGEAPGRIFDTMRQVMGMDMVSEPLRLKSAAAASDCETAREYGRRVASGLQS